MAHTITVEPISDRVEIFWRDHKIVDTRSAVDLKEATYPPVVYAPREDADMSWFRRSTRETHCPFKGEANYFDLVDGDYSDQNAVWTYETPKAGVETIERRLAFYPDKVVIRRTPG